MKISLLNTLHQNHVSKTRIWWNIFSDVFLLDIHFIIKVLMLNWKPNTLFFVVFWMKNLPNNLIQPCVHTLHLLLYLNIILTVWLVHIFIIKCYFTTRQIIRLYPTSGLKSRISLTSRDIVGRFGGLRRITSEYFKEYTYTLRSYTLYPLPIAYNIWAFYSYTTAYNEWTSLDFFL